MDAPMIWLMAALAMSSALMFGLVPALHATRRERWMRRCAPGRR